MGKKEKKFEITRSEKVGNANLYAAIVSEGGDKRVAALAARKHSDMNPKAHQAYVRKKANEPFIDKLKKKSPKPKRARKHSPPQVRRVRKK